MASASSQTSLSRIADTAIDWSSHLGPTLRAALLYTPLGEDFAWISAYCLTLLRRG